MEALRGAHGSLLRFVGGEVKLLNILGGLETLFAVSAFVGLMFMKATYGRYSEGSYLRIPAKIAWCIQESPTLIIGAMNIYTGRSESLSSTANRILLALFFLHYIQRTLIFPFLIRGGKPSSFLATSLAWLFCVHNGYLQTRPNTHVLVYPSSWLTSPQFLIGVPMFFIGWIINLHSDHILRNLRKPGEKDYKIPKGGLFDYVSGANFLGEIIEWTGFAIAAWTPWAASFALMTTLNIGPRAYHHHQWYLEKFRESYPRNRKAIIPFIL